MDNKIRKLAEYVEIEVGILQEPFSIKSINKLIFISFCVYHQANYGKRYNRLDITQTFFRTLSGRLLTNINDSQVIMSGVLLLEKSGLIEVDEKGSIKVYDDLKTLTPNNPFLQKFMSKTMENPIFAVNRLDDKAFMEEVIRYV